MIVKLRRLVPLFCFVTLAPTSLRAQNLTPQQHEQRAQEYLKSRQPDLARKEFAAVLATEPNNLDALANIGVLEYFAGDFEAAATHLRSAITLAPSDPKFSKLQALLGFSERRTGNITPARTDLRAALGNLQDPKVRKQAGLELVELDTAAGDLPSAAATISSLKAALPTDPEVLYAAYRVYTDLAGESMLDLSLAAPDSAQMHQAIAHELVRERDNAAAIANLRAALKTDPGLPGANFELAEILHASSDPALKSEAEQHYQLALQQNPNDDKTLTRLGDLSADKGDHSTAIADYKKTLALQPENTDASIGLAHELVETGQPDAALPLLLSVIKADPTNVLAHYRLSALYRRLHRPEDAKREVTEYQHLKQTQEKLRSIYGAMRMNSPQSAPDEKN